MRNKSFTLAETLLTMVILGVIMAIVMPLMNKVQPDKDVITFRKAMYTLQAAVGNATEMLINDGADSTEIWKSNIVVSSGVSTGFCERIASHLNTTKENCSSSGSFESPQIATTDGIRFWNMPTGAFTDNDYEICMDRTFTKKEAKNLQARRSVAIGDDDMSYSHTGACGSATIEGLSTNYVGLRAHVRWDGKVKIDPDDKYEQYLVDKGFDIQQDK